MRISIECAIKMSLHKFFNQSKEFDLVWLIDKTPQNGKVFNV